MKKCMAADLGGTKILAAEVLEDGTFSHVLRVPSVDGPKRERIRQVIRAVRTYEETYGYADGVRPACLGIGINDVVNPAGSLFLGHDPADPVLSVAPLVREELRMDCRIDNDVKCTVLAERCFGAGRGTKDLLYLNIGTGLAAGIISDGRVIRGSDSFAGEVGFMDFMDGNGPHVELQASGMGIQYQAEALRAQYPDSLLFHEAPTAPGVSEDGLPARERQITGEALFAAAKAGDALALCIRERLIRSAALLISNLTFVLSPEMVVLGGGLMTDPAVLPEIRGRVIPKALQHLEKGIVLTGLDPAYAGLMGAAAIGLGYGD